MTTIILTRPDFGHNTYYICDAMKDTQRVKSDAIPKLGPNDWVIRWGCTAHVAAKGANGPKTINKKSAIGETVNKGTFRSKVAEIGHAPKTWRNVEDWFLEFEPALPVIIRPLFHQRSEGLFFCKTADEVKAAVKKIGPEYYISEYIAKTKEWRVFVAQGRVMIVAEKLPKDRKAITWGCVEDGELDYQYWNDWNPALVKCAVESFNLSKLDFAAIDVMEKDGKFYFLEANTAPEVWRYYGETFGKVFTHMINVNRERIPVVSFDNWKDCIHPALSPLAKVV